MHDTLKRLMLFAGVVALVTVLPPAAAAQGLYIGGAYSWASQSTDNPEFDEDVFEGDASGYKVLAGVELGRFFGLEGSYTNFGTYDALDLEGFDESPREPHRSPAPGRSRGRAPSGGRCRSRRGRRRRGPSRPRGGRS